MNRQGRGEEERREVGVEKRGEKKRVEERSGDGKKGENGRAV